MGAAISAARQGLKVALIQNRPVLGGNGSSEIQVWAKGGTRRGLYPRLGEIVEEFADQASNSPGAPEEFGDARKEAVVRAEPNIALFLNSYVIDAELTPGYCIPYQRVSAHYWRHHYFLAPNQLLDGMPAIRHIPGFIVNGRLDVVCPPVTAFELKRAWPEAELELVPQAGHFSTEPGIATALLRIMERLK